MLTLPPVVTVACGALTWFLGVLLVKKIRLLSQYNLPAPVVGGLVVAIVFAVLHEYDLQKVTFNTQLIPAMMIAFFTSVGYGASIKELQKGGKAVFIFLVACTLLLVIQVGVGATIAKWFGKPALFGVLTSSVSLVGGPGTALSFAPVFEEAGVTGAASAGLAAAMLGIILGGLLGGPICTILIRKHHLHSEGDSAGGVAKEEKHHSVSVEKLGSDLLYHNAWILVMGSVGFYLSKGIESLGVKLPFYVGSMIVAAIIRNLDDKFGCFKIRSEWVDAIGSNCLTLFIAVSMMSLELWSVFAVAGPLLANLAVQATLVCIVAATIMYSVSGRDYDAAVISGGMIGFMLGTTGNALATMSAVTQRYGPAARAFLVVPLVGACFIDFVNAIVISISLNIFR